MISYEDFKKLDMRVGTVREVEPVEGTDKLLKCMVDFGPLDRTTPQPPPQGGGDEDSGLRQIVSGIREFYPDYEQLIGKQLLYVVNLEPRTIRGVESQGMLMAVDGPDGNPVFWFPSMKFRPE